MALAPLPIDSLLPEVKDLLQRQNSLVLEAPPGAGKTTRVPIALQQSGVQEGEVLVLQPRRIAARLAAVRVAEELGERPGETVGWQIRFEEVAGPRTRLRFLTEGVLTRRLISDPDLGGVGAVFLDEFHERHLESDVALALLRRLQRRRPELRLVVMSATLEAAPIARWLSSPILRCQTRRFDVAIEYASRQAGEPLERGVAGAVKRLVRQGLEGYVLVFLPGVAESRRAAEACSELARGADLLVLPLHGSLSGEEQDRALRPAERRKIILSTNVAETSVTIDGVVAVVDSGLARIPSLRSWSGIPTLRLSRVSRASAAQRAGRAGRTRPGRCIRLFSKEDHDGRPAQETPEILRLDLTETVLMLRASGIDPKGLDWLEPPPEDALARASELLKRLGALDEVGMTQLGRKMLRFPVHPRLSRVILQAEVHAAGETGCRAAALLAERRDQSDRIGRQASVGDSDPSDLLDRREDLKVGSTVERVRGQLLGILTSLGRRARPRAHDDHDQHLALRIALLAGFPDRVARRRSQGSDELLLAGGGSATLAASSVVRKAPYLVALDAERVEDPGGPHRAASSRVLVRQASAIEPEWLVDLYPERIRQEVQVAWNAQAERVEATSRLLYDGLVLEESQAPAGNEAEEARVLFDAALARGASAFAEPGELERFRARLAFLSESCPDAGLAALGEGEVTAALAELCRGRRSFAELRQAGLLELLQRRLGPGKLKEVESLAPDRVTLPGGRAVHVQYELGKTPWLESRLQDFFGLTAGPKIAGGQIPVLLHLLAPNRRAVQVTSDLAGFWERTYPALRKELSRKYPRHAWPEDPRRARPPAGRRIR